jgi:hypothetical protein
MIKTTKIIVSVEVEITHDSRKSFDAALDAIKKDPLFLNLSRFSGTGVSFTIKTSGVVDWQYPAKKRSVSWWR